MQYGHGLSFLCPKRKTVDRSRLSIASGRLGFEWKIQKNDNKGLNMSTVWQIKGHTQESRA